MPSIALSAMRTKSTAGTTEAAGSRPAKAGGGRRRESEKTKAARVTWLAVTPRAASAAGERPQARLECRLQVVDADHRALAATAAGRERLDRRPLEWSIVFMLRVDPRNPRGIVWLASYPRSGSTWMRVFLNALYQVLFRPEPAKIDLNRLSGLEASDLEIARYEALLGRRAADITRDMIAAARPNVQMKIAADAGGLVLVKTHNAMIDDRGAPMINKRASAGGIYVLRNPLDCAVSLAEFRGIPIDQAIADMATPGFANYGTGKVGLLDLRLLVGKRRQLDGGEQRADPCRPLRGHPGEAEETFGGVAAHLGFAPRPEQLARAIELASFQNLQNSEKRHGFSERPQDSALFFREGRAGQWRDRLTRCASRENHRRPWRTDEAIRVSSLKKSRIRRTIGTDPCYSRSIG